MFCVLATNDDAHANHDATHDGDHHARAPLPCQPRERGHDQHRDRRHAAGGVERGHGRRAHARVGHDPSPARPALRRRPARRLRDGADAVPARGEVRRRLAPRRARRAPSRRLEGPRAGSLARPDRQPAVGDRRRDPLRLPQRVQGAARPARRGGQPRAGRRPAQEGGGRFPAPAGPRRPSAPARAPRWRARASGTSGASRSPSSGTSRPASSSAGS
jgi:hypothetical protein